MFFAREQNVRPLGGMVGRSILRVHRTEHAMAHPRGRKGRSTWSTHVGQGALVGFEDTESIEIIIHQTLSMTRCAIYGCLSTSAKTRYGHVGESGRRCTLYALSVRHEVINDISYS